MSNGAPWYTFPRIDNFGLIDPAGPFWKPDTNVQIPGNYPVTALLPGTITSLQQNTGFGQDVVTIGLDQPLNQLATHTFYEHLGGFASGDYVGEHVSAGQLIGYNNPSGQVPLGFGLYSGDVYGSGPAWSQLQADLAPGGRGLLNPVSLLDTMKSGGTPQHILPNGFDCSKCGWYQNFRCGYITGSTPYIPLPGDPSKDDCNNCQQCAADNVTPGGSQTNEALNKISSMLVKKDFWIRLGIGLVALILIVMGITLFIRGREVIDVQETL